MEFSSLLSGVDNLFKFLFIGGLVMVLTSLFYPLQKQQELDIEINSYNKDAKLLNQELSVLKKELEIAASYSKNTRRSLNNLVVKRNSALDLIAKNDFNKKIKATKVNYNDNIDSLRKWVEIVDKKLVTIDYNKSKIKILQRYANTYSSYTSILLWGGSIFVLIGLSGWTYSTVINEKMKLKELRRP